MSEPDISPLARRLAEENNVEWRGLHGSGGGGKVVERDVLEYLARVMAGDEDLDPTPEPLPEGMTAWPEDDLAGFQREARAADRGSELDDIQRELSASDRSYEAGSGVEPPFAAAAEGPQAAADLEEISEDIFLFDDDDGGAEERDALDFGAASRAPIDDLDDGLLVAGDDDDDDAEVEEAEEDLLWSGASAASQPDTLPDIFAAESEPSVADAPEDAVDEASLDLFAEPGATTAPRGSTELDIPSFDELDMSADASATAESAEAVEPDEAQVGVSVPAGAAADAVIDATGAGPDSDEGPDDGSEARPEEFDEPAHVGWTAPYASDGGRDLGEPHHRESVGDVDVTQGDRDLDGPAADGTFETAPEPSDAVASAGAEAAALHAADVEAESADEVADVEPWIAPVAMGGVVVEEGSSGLVEPHAVPLVRYGSMLRRHLDLTSLASAQLAVSQEFGEEDPLPPTAFLVRAAAKAMADGGWEGRTLLAAFTDDGLHLSDVGSVARGAFRSLIDAVRGDRGEDVPAEGAALVIADMSGLDVDEAVLNVGAPVLTLGRILYDNQRGSYRSTLTISGDVPPERGARLLAKAAELLDTPIRLVL